MKIRMLSLLLIVSLLTLPLLAACQKAPTDEGATTLEDGLPTEPTDEIPNDPAPSVFSGTPDTSWYTGDKTEYILTTADQFMGFNALRVQKITFEGVTVKLACDVVINKGTAEEMASRGKGNISWSAINSKNFFMGTFDGQGHTVYGVYMQLTDSALKGMFGSLSGNATIKNLTLENCYFGGTSVDKTILGCLSPRVTNGGKVTISNVHIKNALMKEGAGAMTDVGGFVGVVETGCSLTMENCSFSGNIKFGTKGSKLGGFVGEVKASGTVTLNNCSVDANIEAVESYGAFVGLQAATATVNKNDCTPKEEP